MEEIIAPEMVSVERWGQKADWSGWRRKGSAVKGSRETGLWLKRDVA